MELYVESYPLSINEKNEYFNFVEYRFINEFGYIKIVTFNNEKIEFIIFKTEEVQQYILDLCVNEIEFIMTVNIDTIKLMLKELRKTDLDILSKEENEKAFNETEEFLEKIIKLKEENDGMVYN